MENTQYLRSISNATVDNSQSSLESAPKQGEDFGSDYSLIADDHHLKKPTEGEIEAFLENVKELVVGGSSGFKAGIGSNQSLELTSQDSQNHLLSGTLNTSTVPQNGIHNSNSIDEMVVSTIHTKSLPNKATVSYKPGGTLLRTIINDIALTVNNECITPLKYGIVSSDELKYSHNHDREPTSLNYKNIVPSDEPFPLKNNSDQGNSFSSSLDPTKDIGLTQDNNKLEGFKNDTFNSFSNNPRSDIISNNRREYSRNAQLAQSDESVRFNFSSHVERVRDFLYGIEESTRMRSRSRSRGSERIKRSCSRDRLKSGRSLSKYSVEIDKRRRYSPRMARSRSKDSQSRGRRNSLDFDRPMNRGLCRNSEARSRGSHRSSRSSSRSRHQSSNSRSRGPYRTSRSRSRDLNRTSKPRSRDQSERTRMRNQSRRSLSREIDRIRRTSRSYSRGRRRSRSKSRGRKVHRSKSRENSRHNRSHSREWPSRDSKSPKNKLSISLSREAAGDENLLGLTGTSGNMSQNIHDIYSQPLPQTPYPSAMGVRMQQYPGGTTGALPPKLPNCDINAYGGLHGGGFGISMQYLDPVARSYPLPQSFASSYPMRSEPKQDDSWGLPPPYTGTSDAQSPLSSSWRDPLPPPSFRDQPPSRSFCSKSRSRSRSKERRKQKSKTTKHSRSPDHLHKRHRHSDSRSPIHSVDSKKHRCSESPPDFRRFDEKKSKIVIDPNRIPTPPPPPILRSHDNKNDGSKNRKEKDMKATETSSDAKQKDSVSLSSLLEAVMETSGERKTKIFNTKTKKAILNTCETKIRKLYQKRMSGLGAFIPEPLKERWVHPQCSSLTLFHPHLTYIEGDEKTLWRYPDIPLPEVKLVNPEEIKPLKSPLSCLLDIETRKTAPVEVPPTKPVPPTKVSKPAPNPTQHMGMPPPIHSGGALPPSKPPGFNNTVYPAPSSVPHHPPGPLPIMHSEPIPPPLNSGPYPLPPQGVPRPMPHPGMMHQGGPPVLQPRWQGYGGGPITYPQPPYSQNVWQPIPQNNVGPTPPTAYPSGIDPMQNVAYPLHSYNSQRNFNDLGKGNPLHETDNYGKRSPDRKRSSSPQMRHSSPSRRRTPSPLRRRGHLPRRRRTPSPMRRRTPSPLRRRGPSPHKRHTSSPFRRCGHSPHRKRTPSPLRRRGPSPRRRRTPSPLRRRTPSPLRRRTPSPQKRLSYSHSRCEPLLPVNRFSPQPHTNREDERLNYVAPKQISQSYEGTMPKRKYSPSRFVWVNKNYSTPNKPNMKASENLADSLNKQTMKDNNNPDNAINRQSLGDNKNSENDLSKLEVRTVPVCHSDAAMNVNLSEIVCTPEPEKPVVESKNSSSDMTESNELNNSLRSADKRDPKKVQKSDIRSEGNGSYAIKSSSNDKEASKHDGFLSLSKMCDLGQTIRNIQEKTMYKSIIDSFLKGDTAYRRMFIFVNKILCKYKSDKHHQIIMPRDYMKEFISVLHKEYHNVSKGHLIRSIRLYVYPTTHNVHIDTVVSKVLKECPTCRGIPQSSKTESLVKTPKFSKSAEKKAQKKVTNADSKIKSVKSNDKSLTASSRKSSPDSQVSIDGRPSGYEKATKSKALLSKQVSSTDNKSNTSPSKSPSNPHNEENDGTNNALPKINSFNSIPMNATRDLEPVAKQSSHQQINSNDKNTPITDKAEPSTIELNITKTLADETSITEEKQLNESDKTVAPPSNPSEPQMDFKVRIRNAQMKTKEFHDIMIGIESKNKSDIDDSYILKGGMLCKKLVLPDGSSGVRILAPLANVSEVINIVHTMGAAHTTSSKVIAFFSKHFSPVDDLENLINDIVNMCPVCNK